jgi:hypothetical protein
MLMAGAEREHDCETDPVDNRKVLVAVGEPDLPSCFQVCRAYRFDYGHATTQAIPETVGGAIPNRPEFACRTSGRLKMG